MTKEILEKLRKEHKQEMIDFLLRIHEIYRNFADKINNDEILTKEDWQELCDCSMKTVWYKDEDGDEDTVFLDDIFNEDYFELTDEE